jgi:hypothetical protein
MGRKHVDRSRAENDSLTEAQLSAVLNYIRHVGPMTMTKREREIVEQAEPVDRELGKLGRPPTPLSA